MPSSSKCHHFWREHVDRDTRFAMAGFADTPKLPEEKIAQHDRINYYSAERKAFFTRGVPHPLMNPSSAMRSSVAPGQPDPMQRQEFKARVVAGHNRSQEAIEKGLLPVAP